jgi:triose/dihydroxyacetone kinase / FAD-AMP lyase (cyclizing)
MQTFMNQKSSLVSDAIDGLIVASGGKVQRLNASSHARVVVRSDWDNSRVAIVSGGGSGHEPAHAGLVGPGLLTAAICGDVFASPSVDAVLSGILAVTGPSGCLLIVKNYTGDRLNFGLAAEKAKALGLNVEMIIVADDVSIPGAPRPRGVAGTVFIHKIAGQMSEDGGSLGDILGVVNSANSKIATIGVARDTCTVPGSPKQNRVEEDMVEIGLGIHGEPGVEAARFDTSKALATEVAGRLDTATGNKNTRYAALFNNLGGLSGLEMAVLFNDFMQTPFASKISLMSGPATLVTALDMPGFSVSLIELDDSYTHYLTSPVDCAAWANFVEMKPVAQLPAPPLPDVFNFPPSRDDKVRRVIEIIAQRCLEIEADINELDAKVGDGDTGSTFAGAARAVFARIDDLPFAQGAQLLAALGDIKTKAMGGSSGVLFAILLAKASEGYKLWSDWPKSLHAGLLAMQQYGGAQVNDRTMVDALRPAFESILAGGTIKNAAALARAGADRTAQMTSAKAGRSSYLEARSLNGVPDPGAEAVAQIFEALASKLD